MALLFDEKFEGAGYEEDSSGQGGNWSENASTGCTVDEDADPSGLSGGTPTGWGSDCLECTTDDANENARATNKLDSAINKGYYRLDIHTAGAVTTVDGHGANGQASCIKIGTNFTADLQIHLQIFNDAGTVKWRCLIHDNGADVTAYGLASPVDDTTYIHEWYYDSDTNRYEWKIDGVVQAFGTGTALLAAQRQWDIGLVGSNSPANTLYFDRFAIDDAAYPDGGTEESFGEVFTSSLPPYILQSGFNIDTDGDAALSPTEKKRLRRR